MKRFRFALPVALLILLTGVSALAQNELTGLERGSVTIFNDDFESETVGEFPSRWDLVKGRAEVTRHEGQNVLAFLTTGTTVKPFMQEQKYLPGEFMIEFEYLMNHFSQHTYEIVFMDERGRRSANLRITGRRYILNPARGGNNFEGETPFTSSNFTPGWKQFAMSYNQGEVRIFCNGQRILNVPRFQAEITSIEIQGGRPESSRPNPDAFIRNVFITEGGAPIYDQIMTEGKFVTNEIQFDVNRYEIKPESYPVLEQVFQMMQQHESLFFSVEGHTDSDGDPELNQTLSKNRAESVKRRLIEMGLSEDRLTAKGWGASKPVADNETAQGKALNRRVEFIKMDN